MSLDMSVRFHGKPVELAIRFGDPFRFVRRRTEVCVEFRGPQTARERARLEKSLERQVQDVLIGRGERVGLVGDPPVLAITDVGACDDDGSSSSSAPPSPLR